MTAELNALRRTIAERLGYKFMTAAEIGIGGPAAGAGIVLDPDGKPLHFLALPDWPRDANARLPLQEGMVIDLSELWNGEAMAQVVITVTGKHFPWQTGATLAEARARAWLAWKDGQDGK